MNQELILPDGVEIGAEELTHLCALDSNLYGRMWFPNTCRQDSPLFHMDMDKILDNPFNRYVAFEIFRGGAKTTKFRLYSSKRIAYAVSNTMLFVGKSEEHAVRSVEWLMLQVEQNKRWAQFYGLRKGSKWTSSEIEIINETFDYAIRVIAIGITGSVRGINVNDYRPDFILLDDPCDEVNTGTPEARQKIEDLVFGALMKSLAPRSEAPNAMMALAQTPLDEQDLIEKAMKDPDWVSVRYGCFTDKGESSWPERWTTEELQKEKDSHIRRGQLSLWLREMECILVNDQNTAFRGDWLNEYYLTPEYGINYIGIDPTPPPKDSMKKEVNEKLDDAVIFAIKYYDNKVYVLDYYLAKSPNPSEFITKIFEFVFKYKPLLTGVETTLFQRMLKWALEEEMARRGQYFTITPVEDKRKKETRIIQTISRYASNGKIYVRPEHLQFKEQYGKFRNNITGQRDDILDAFSIALDLINPALEGVIIEGEYSVDDESNIPELEDLRGAP